MRERGKEGGREGEERDAQIKQAKEETVRGRQGAEGGERETVKEANRIRMGECEWESLA